MSFSKVQKDIIFLTIEHLETNKNLSTFQSAIECIYKVMNLESSICLTDLQPDGILRISQYKLCLQKITTFFQLRFFFSFIMLLCILKKKNI